MALDLHEKESGAPSGLETARVREYGEREGST